MEEMDIESSPTEAAKGHPAGKKGKKPGGAKAKPHGAPDDASAGAGAGAQAHHPETASQQSQTKEEDAGKKKYKKLSEVEMNADKDRNLIAYNPCCLCKCFNLRRWCLIIAIFTIVQAGLHMAELKISPPRDKCHEEVDDGCFSGNPQDFKACKEQAIETCAELTAWHDQALIGFCVISLLAGAILLAEHLLRIWILGIISIAFLIISIFFYWILTGLQWKLAKAINAYGGGKGDQIIHMIKGLIQTLVYIFFVICIVGLSSQVRVKADDLAPGDNPKFRQRYFVHEGHVVMVTDKHELEMAAQAQNNQVAPAGAASGSISAA